MITVSEEPPVPDGSVTRMASARIRLLGGVAERSGSRLSASQLAERVGWCADLVSGMVADLVARHFNMADVSRLASGVDAGGRRLPAHAWMALRRLGWTVRAPVGATITDRIARMAQEQAGRTLRESCRRADLVTGVLATWPANPRRRSPAEWDAVRAAIDGGRQLPANVITARTRQITGFVQAHGRLPVDVYELEGAPGAARMLLLSACDRQQAVVERVSGAPERAVLRLRLPIRPQPRSYGDWEWIACPIKLPPTVPASAKLHLPTVWPAPGAVRADLAFSHQVPPPSRTGHRVGLGVDWGLNTLLTAGAARLHADGAISALGSGGQFRAAGVVAKLHRLRRLSESLRAKADRQRRIADGRTRRGLGVDPALRSAQEAVSREARAVSARRTRLGDALARASARWAVDQAVAARASVIYLEDLRSMDARGMTRAANTRLSQQVRGRIAARIRHMAAEVGIAVVMIPARNTSRHCPGCLTPLRHRKAPDRSAEGWKWAVCPACGWQGDRDDGAWRRIVARGLSHQATTVTDSATGVMLIPAVVDTLEARAVITPARKTRRPDRSKTGPTRRRPPRPAPRRRGAPSPAGPTGLAGRRPEGHAPTDRARLPRAAVRHQGVLTSSEPSRRHRPRGTALGAGFHLHAHASPPRWETVPDNTSAEGHPAAQRR
ncbi:zinc ribbon domain-containing protein [Nonomuraea sp. NPDC003214]